MIEISDGGRYSLSLLENCYSSLNESMSKAEAAEDDARQWKFAVLHIVHAVELLLKERLHREHRLFIYQNVDKPTRTVSLEGALFRLESIDVAVTPADDQAIRTAIKWRNQITHHNVDLQLEEVRRNYLVLFEFVWNFHMTHFGSSTSAHFEPEHLIIAADLVRAFKEELIDFDDRRMHRTWPARLFAAQRIKSIPIGTEEVSRIPWGSESIWSHPSMLNSLPAPICRDCACRIGELHGPACCLEECPSCLGQFFGCECDFGPSELWALFGEGDEESVDHDDSAV